MSLWNTVVHTARGAADRVVNPPRLRDTTALRAAVSATPRMSAPTPIMRALPGLFPDEAAQIVARAVVRRPRDIEPWWVWPAGVASAAAPGAMDLLMRGWVRCTRDTDAALGKSS
ncbi:hypothetical protein IU474_02425 [Nocardia otitidiscaviarum]|uniref:hypothetical protein n=1 Tax=Nocardia otitidiscaviarum TaxID=1823 RepID=UPI00189580E9|nr:hypothetical protein [Nocardia otitidiscaviarum]MBF6235935.1 hypothetical protein [Nocardia otitidiscaviarum]